MIDLNMLQSVQAVHPALAAGMRFINLEEPALERLASEQRLDVKRNSTSG